jgi:molecular chaperone GrpE
MAKKTRIDSDTARKGASAGGKEEQPGPTGSSDEAGAQEERSAAPDRGEAETVEPEERAPTPEAALAEKEALVADLQNQILYLHSELENFKKRTEKRYREALDFAAEPLLKDLLPVLDNLERAVEHGREGGSDGLEPLLEGLSHVIQQFTTVLGRHGVAQVPAESEKFDPTVHEAMVQVPGEEDGRVGDVYEKGYTLKGRLLRPAKVTVTKVASGEGDG